jgi:hypothetical protein
MNRCLLTVLLVVLPVSAFAQAPAEPAPAQPPAPAPWYERLRFGADFRSRYEGFYEDAAETRHRVRMRFRLRLDTDVNEDVAFHLQLASGDPGTPVSTNQTFTEFFLPKPIHIDRAYIDYNPQAASALTLGFGKFNPPQTTTQMVFDEDLNYEGGFEQVSWELRDGIGVNVIALQTVLNERSSAADAYMLGAYGELALDAGPHALQFSAANYSWGNEDQIAVASAGGPLESILTNRVRRSPAGAVVGYESQFNVIDFIAEGTVQTGRDGYPLRLLADYARNTKATTGRDSGLWLEAEYGAPRATGTWGAGYTYAWVEQDVTPSAYVFSDMPGTNVRAHILESSYVLKTGMSLDATLHLTKRLFADAITGGAAVPGSWLSRLHLAAVLRF